MKEKLLTNGWVTFRKDPRFDEFAAMSDNAKRIHFFVDQHSLPEHVQVNIYKKGENIQC